MNRSPWRGPLNRARYHFADDSPWLLFYRNETRDRLFNLVNGRWSKPKNDDDSDQQERLGWILALPDDWADDALHMERIP